MSTHRQERIDPRHAQTQKGQVQIKTKAHLATALNCALQFTHTHQKMAEDIFKFKVFECNLCPITDWPLSYTITG